jgi:phospholipase C
MLGAISSTTPSRIRPSIARFIEDNWGLPRLGGEAMDQWAGSLAGMFDFNMPARTDVLILDPATGMPSGGR